MHADSKNGHSHLGDLVTGGSQDRHHIRVTENLPSENGSGNPDAGEQNRAITPITPITGVAKAEKDADAKCAPHLPLLTVEDALAEIRVANSGPAKTAAVYGRGQTRFEYLVKAVLYARGLAMDDWERHAPVVEAAFERWTRSK